MWDFVFNLQYLAIEFEDLMYFKLLNTFYIFMILTNLTKI